MFGNGGVSERCSVKSQETNTEGMAKRITRFGNNVNSYATRYENYTQDFVDTTRFPEGNVVGLQRVGEARDWKRRERPSTSYYLEEENSKCLVHGNYGFGDSMEERYHHQKDQFDGIGYIVDDRAELMRKLNELRDQLNRTCDIADKSKDKFLVEKPYIIDHYPVDASSKQLRRGLHQAYAPFEHKPFCTHFSGLYMDRNRVHTDSFESYPPPNMNRHHALCSSSSCNSKSKVPINAYGERWFPHHASEDEASYYDHCTSVNELQRHASLLPFPDESYRSMSPRVVTANSGHICQPIAGGAPFLTCLNCFELLILPKKVFIGSENRKKVKCGACSVTIVVVVDTNRLDFSVQTYQNDDEGTSKRFRAKMSFSYEDFDNSASDFQQGGRELGTRSTSKISSRKSSEAKSIDSRYSTSSDKAQKVQTSPAREKELIISTEMAVKGKATPPPAGSPLQQYFDYSDKFRVMKHISPRQSGLSMRNSIKDGSATEMDISSNEFSNTGTSLNSGEASKEGANKVAEHLENNFKDLNMSKNDIIISQEKVDVTINGKVIPDFLIKKAEKLAGPIYPGYYWYDFRAGFWGVKDGPCLGIIPPFIEEFNYPMQESCRGDKTGVFVNGRELHEKDLKLLSRRGLPTERDRSYIVEISGRVLDENTGEELERLGKLAPTVERSNHGFGMRDPILKQQLK